MRVVKDVMVMEKNSNYTLAYKTGWGQSENGDDVAWIIGWIEESRHPHFFALNFNAKPGSNIPEIRMNMLRGILTQLGYFKGKM